MLAATISMIGDGVDKAVFIRFPIVTQSRFVVVQIQLDEWPIDMSEYVFDKRICV